MDDKKIRIYIALGLFTLALIALGLSFLFFEPYINGIDSDNQTCGNATHERQCYNASEDTCLTVWEKFEDACKEEVKGKLNPNQMTSLVGPSIRWCIQKKFDRTIKGMRKIEPNPFCQPYFRKLDAQSL